MRTLFFGTPDFAVPSLRAMVEAGYGPILVISQPARRSGRGRRLHDPPVAVWAREHDLEVRQVEKVRDPVFLAELAAREPDVAVVVAFGQIFRRRLLELPDHGCLNVHASLLPRYRGAAPIQRAIAAGETVTGVTTMQMDIGLDTGPILRQAELPIGGDETAAELSPRLAELGARILVETLRDLEHGRLEPRAQDDSLASTAPLLSRDDARVDWRLPARRLYDRLRGFTPWPGLVAELREAPLKILAARPLGNVAAGNVAAGNVGETAPGTLRGLRDGCLAVECGASGAVDGGSATILGLERVQRPGRKPVSAVDLFHGERLRAGESFARPISDS